jgi:hypothetical protein
MHEWTPIQYRGFWDVPRVFLATHQGEVLLFDSAFDESLDDYHETYKVYVMPLLRPDELPADWTTLRSLATCFLGEIPISRVEFDATRRKSIHRAVLDELRSRKAAC